MRLGPDTRQAVSLIIGTWILSGLLFLFPFHLFQGGAKLYELLSVIRMCGLGALLSLGLYWIAHRVRHRSTLTRIGAVSGGIVLAAALLAFIDGLAVDLMKDYLEPNQPTTDFSFRVANNFVVLIWQFGLLGAAFTALEAQSLARMRERELADAREAASRAEAAASAARLAALRYQLNPHFLFNTLNAISSLIVTRDFGPADAMLAKLSEFLRATLAADPDALLPLEDELATLQHYLEIEATRFEDRLAVDFACPARLNDVLVPSFILQPLVENAIKYAVAPSARPVTIRVEATADKGDLVIVVEDDGAPESAGASGMGVGLANVRQRLETLYKGRGSLETVRRETGFIAIIRMPLTHRVTPIRALTA